MNYKKIRLGNLSIEWKRGQGLRKSDINENGLNKCVLYGELYTKHKKMDINFDDLSNTNAVSKVLSKKGDILVPGTSTAKKTQMLLARQISNDNVYLGGDINIIRPQTDLFADKYLPYFFQTKDAYEQLESFITGATGIIHISNKGLKELKVPLFELPEQKQIVAILDKAFAAINQAQANIEKNIENAKELFQSKLNDIFSQKGDGWEEKSLGEVCSLYQGLAINKNTKHLLVEKSSLPLLRIKDLRNNTEEQYVAESGFPANSLVTEDEIIYTRTGNSLGLVFRGRHGILHNNSFKIIPNKSLSNDYLFWWLQHEAFTTKIIGLASKAAQPDITHKLFKQQKISIPKIELQADYFNQIENLNDSIKKQIGNYEMKINNLEDLKKSILQKAFSGELTSTSSATTQKVTSAKFAHVK